IPLHLDLYVLISSCVAHSYENSLNHLSQIITFFHNNNTFSNLDDLTANTGSTKFKLNIKLYSPISEHTNYIQNFIGDKQFPNVLYHMQLIEILGTEESPVDKPIKKKGINII